MRIWRTIAAALLLVLAGAAGGSGAQAPRSPGAVLADLEALRAELGRVAAAGGWARIPSGPALEVGDRGARVALLRERLWRAGDLSGEGRAPADAEAFDAELDTAVRRFQARHGLVADGIVGSATIGALDVPVERRIAQIDANLVRWRALPQDLGENYVLVNAAAFQVELVEAGTVAGRYRAIVGRTDRPTPVFTAEMTYVALAPFWEVPPGIARNDVLPRIKADPGYLAAQRMRVFDAATGRAVDPITVNWSEVTSENVNLGFRFRADPGPTNPLGRVKFIYPNPNNSYMHDTPARELFERPVRTFSSGCVRVESALDLAVRILGAVPGWSLARIEETIARGVEHRVDLPRPLRVYVQYFTAWVDEDGVPQFREDIYGRDGAARSGAADRGTPASTVGLARALFAAPSAAPSAIQDIASCPD
jgi:murein L,D-transpeptidase YcbB/YkuD